MRYRVKGVMGLIALLSLAAHLCPAAPPVRFIGEVRMTDPPEQIVSLSKDWIRPELNPVFQAKYGLYVAMVKSTGAEQDRAIQVAIAGARFYSPQAKATWLPYLLHGLKSNNYLMRRDAAFDLVFATFALPKENERGDVVRWTTDIVAPGATSPQERGSFGMMGCSADRAYLPDLPGRDARKMNYLGVFWACPPGSRLPPGAGPEGAKVDWAAMQKKLERDYGPATARTHGNSTPRPNVLQQQVLKQMQMQQFLTAQLMQQLNTALNKLLTSKDEELEKALKDNQPIVRLLALQVAAARNRNDDLVDRLADPVVEVRQAARAMLYQLSEGKDFGPEPNASAEDQAKAQKKWKEWLEKNKVKPLVPDNLDELAKSASLHSSEKK